MNATAIAPETTAALDLDREEQEWAALEREHDYDPRTRTFYMRGPQSGPKVSNKPHPDSYGAHVPLWSRSGAGLLTLTAAEKKELQARPIRLTLYDEPKEYRASLNEKRQQKAQLVAASVGFLLA